MTPLKLISPLKSSPSPEIELDTELVSRSRVAPVDNASSAPVPEPGGSACCYRNGYRSSAAIRLKDSPPSASSHCAAVHAADPEVEDSPFAHCEQLLVVPVVAEKNPAAHYRPAESIRALKKLAEHYPQTSSDLKIFAHCYRSFELSSKSQRHLGLWVFLRSRRAL